MNFREIRLKAGEFRTQEENDGRLTVSGYVNLIGEFSDPLSLSPSERFIETIEKGAFKSAIERSKELGEDIDFIIEHDKEKILASTRNGSLFLEEDEKGLFMSAVIIPTTYGRDFYQLIKEKVIQNFSFGFVVKDEEWDFSTTPYTRRIKDLELFEVSAVRYPAYPQNFLEARNLTASDTILETRRLEAMKEENKEEVREMEEVETEEEETPSTIDVAGSVISIDQKLEKIDKKLDEVLAIFLDKKEEVEEVEEEELKEEKKEEEDKEKEAIKSKKVVEEEKEEEERSSDLEINEKAIERLKKLIEENEEVQ